MVNKDATKKLREIMEEMKGLYTKSLSTPAEDIKSHKDQYIGILNLIYRVEIMFVEELDDETLDLLHITKDEMQNLKETMLEYLFTARNWKNGKQEP